MSWRLQWKIQWRVAWKFGNVCIARRLRLWTCTTAFLLLVGWLLSTTLCKLAPSSAIVGMRRITTSTSNRTVRERSLGWQVGCVLFEDSCSQSNYIRGNYGGWESSEFVGRSFGENNKMFRAISPARCRDLGNFHNEFMTNSLSAHSSRDIEQPFFRTHNSAIIFLASAVSFFFFTLFAESMLRTHSILIIFHENLNSSRNKWMKCEENNKPKNDIGVRRARVQRTKKLFIRKKEYSFRVCIS